LPFVSKRRETISSSCHPFSNIKRPSTFANKLNQHNPKYIFETFILQNKVTSGFQEAHFGKNIVHTRTFMQAVLFWMPHIFSFLGIHLGQNTSGKISKIHFQIFCPQVGPLLEINRFHLNIIWCFVNVSME